MEKMISSVAWLIWESVEHHTMDDGDHHPPWGYQNSIMKFRRVHQGAVLGAEGRTRRLCLQDTGANSPVLLLGKILDREKLECRGWTKKQRH